MVRKSDWYTGNRSRNVKPCAWIWSPKFLDFIRLQYICEYCHKTRGNDFDCGVELAIEPICWWNRKSIIKSRLMASCLQADAAATRLSNEQLLKRHEGSMLLDGKSNSKRKQQSRSYINEKDSHQNTKLELVGVVYELYIRSMRM